MVTIFYQMLYIHCLRNLTVWLESVKNIKSPCQNFLLYGTSDPFPITKFLRLASSDISLYKWICRIFDDLLNNTIGRILNWQISERIMCLQYINGLIMAYCRAEYYPLPANSYSLRNVTGPAKRD